MPPAHACHAGLLEPRRCSSCCSLNVPDALEGHVLSLIITAFSGQAPNLHHIMLAVIAVHTAAYRVLHVPDLKHIISTGHSSTGDMWPCSISGATGRPGASR